MSAAPPSRTTRVVRAALYLLATVPLAAAGLTVLVAGWSLTLALAVTPLVLPAVIGFGAAVRLLARAEAGVARGLLGAAVAPPAPAPGGGLWRRARATVAGGAFWRGQAWLALRVVLGWPLSFAWLGLLAAGLQGAAAPLTYRWIPQDGDWRGFDLGLRRIDTLRESLVLVPVGLTLVVAALALAPVLAGWWRRPAVALLGGRAPVDRFGGPPTPAAPGNMGTVPPPPAPVPPRRALAVHAAVAGGLGLLLVVLWVLTTAGRYFWPVWPLLALAAVLAVHALVVAVLEHRTELARRRLTPAVGIHAGVSAVLVAFVTAVWVVVGFGRYFWPVWVALGLAVPLAVHWAVAQRRRIEHLETARTDVVTTQDADLRRIERDLHDGAQARLVALGMHLGMAEQKLATDPEGARALVTEARQGVGEALQELRDLVRGIRPPVLADRGLEAAIAALADRSPVPVDVTAHVVPRPSDPVETAAYFVVAESLANAAKHAGASRVDVRLERRGDLLRVEVADDGCGAADAGGSGLTGLRRRVEALDGTFAVTSPAGGPTIVRAELPCGS